MATILDGKAVAAGLQTALKARVQALGGRGIAPTLATMRIGASDADESYLRRIGKVCEATGVLLRREQLPAEATQAEAEALLRRLNEDPQVHGILLFRPVPKGLDEAALCALVAPRKDVDGMSPASAAALYLGADTGFAPCTAAACIEILKHYGVPLAGRRAVVIGRSAVVGRPLAMLLLGQNATVTVCHSRSEELPSLCREADVLIAAAGKQGLVTAAHVKPGAVVLDVGIHWDEAAGRLRGDVDFDAAAPLAGAITPVPGGVGAVTATILAAHTVEAAERRTE